MGNYEDKTLTCADCGREFQWTARDQEFFAEKGFQQPKRCRECRQEKKRGKGDGGSRDGRAII
jgi:DNA replicative helicase MCM subunit Mcm2 (Cdc46/Mcm family)